MTYTSTILTEKYEYICPFREDRAVVFSAGRETLNIIDSNGTIEEIFEAVLKDIEDLF